MEEEKGDESVKYEGFWKPKRRKRERERLLLFMSRYYMQHIYGAC